jgi:hypothetical protein
MIGKSDLLLQVVWRKSSRSAAGNSNCVEIASLPNGYGIRDSKAAPDGPVLIFEGAVFHSFIATVKSGALDLPEHRTP